MTRQANDTNTQPFGEFDPISTLSALNEHQRRYQADHQKGSAHTNQPPAMPTEEVRRCLAELGLEGGLDETATGLFFGPTGQDGYTEGDENFATNTYGGFIFVDLEEDQLHAMTYTSISGFVPEASNLKPRPKWMISASPPCYEVQPRFYEDIGQTELLPFAGDVEDPDDAGLASVYPVDDESEVCTDTGAVAVNHLHQALELAHSLGRVMAEYGVLCEPRVVLLERRGLPLLPHHARLEALRKASRRQDQDEGEPDKDEPDKDDPEGRYQLGAAHLPAPHTDPGHRVRKELSSLVPDQSEALSLARKASTFVAYQRAVDKYLLYLDDPRVPERRKQDLRRRLHRFLASRDEARSLIQDECHALVGLIVSLLDERRELAKDALRH